MEDAAKRNVVLTDGELLRRAGENRSYLMSLDTDNLLLNYRLEAGRTAETYGLQPKNIHGGWEFPTCQLRGHFLGHWLSAAALEYARTGDRELLGKAEYIVDELALCQKDNGGQWAASIPEKYFQWIGLGKSVWAPHYTVHKTFMGLIDVYLYGHYEKALEVADQFADWFVEYSGKYTREEFDDILDFETGGMLEIWAQLLEITGKEKYRVLLERYYRRRLFEPLLKGEDPLTNMHANTTIPEVIGCARAYEATGEERWRKIAEAYWKCAVTDRGTYATGGQTCGEVWTSKHEMASRLGDKNQEHCTVYNMIRLADFLFRWTKDPLYAEYIERNLYNGIMAQAYWKGSATHGQKSPYPDKGLLTYFLPLRAGGRKGWASETGDFFCCHGTVVQANAMLDHYLYYQEEDQIYVCQYFDSRARFVLGGQTICIEQKEDTLSGSFHLSSTSPARQSISSVTSEYGTHPEQKKIYFAVRTENEVNVALHFRIPEWTAEAASVTINGEPVQTDAAPGSFLVLKRTWKDGDTVGLKLKKCLHTIPLEGDSTKAAFAFGPVVLAGLCEREQVLYGDREHPETILEHANEREWGNWKEIFQTKEQETSIRFVPLKEVGYEAYTVYFPIWKRGQA